MSDEGRNASSAEGLGALAAALEREHREIDRGIEAFLADRERGQGHVEPLRRAMEALRRHIFLEEEFVFPSLQAAGLVAPIFVMLREHGEIWDTLEVIEAQLDAGVAMDRWRPAVGCSSSSSSGTTSKRSRSSTRKRTPSSVSRGARRSRASSRLGGSPRAGCALAPAAPLAGERYRRLANWQIRPRLTLARTDRRLAMHLRLHPLAPFRLDLTTWALRRRAQNAIDAWDGHTYRRALLIGRLRVAVAVTQVGSPDAPRLDVAITGAGLSLGIGEQVEATLTRMLGLDVDLSGFYARAARDQALAALAARYLGLKPPRFPSLFECLLNAVACKQLSLAAGLTMLSRLAAASSPPVGPLHPFPAPEDVLRLSTARLRQLGFSERKAKVIMELARAATDGAFA